MEVDVELSERGFNNVHTTCTAEDNDVVAEQCKEYTYQRRFGVVVRQGD